MRLLGIDYGTQKIGIAVSDDDGRVAFPRDVIANDERLLGKIASLCTEEGVAKVVMGESRDYSGNENPMMEEVRRFGADLEEATGVPVVYEPEILTTQEARRSPSGKEQKSRTPRSREPVDAKAAAILLQSYIDRNF